MFSLQVTKSRKAAIQPLLQLSGRLKLVMAQVESLRCSHKFSTSFQLCWSLIGIFVCFLLDWKGYKHRKSNFIARGPEGWKWRWWWRWKWNSLQGRWRLWNKQRWWAVVEFNFTLWYMLFCYVSPFLVTFSFWTTWWTCTISL